MGVKIDQLDIPVCNSFKEKIVRDQLCYTVDPNEYRKFLDETDELGLVLFINYNEDRQVSMTNDQHVSSNNKETEYNFVIIETIGNIYI